MPELELTALSGQTIHLDIENRMLIDGGLVGNGDTFDVECPSTGDHLAAVPNATQDDIDRAVGAARQASQEWRTRSPMERRKQVEQLESVYLDYREQITNLEVADNGSTIARLKYDIDKAVDNLKYYAGLATELKGDTIPSGHRNLDFTRREPYGAVAAVIPFNHPAMFLAEKLAPAVIAGNGIVLKPSEYTPLSALYLGRLINEADLFPDGLVNIVTGGATAGKALVEHPGVGMISMIGSVTTGRKIMESASANLTPLQLELGGKNPFVVFSDANVDDVIDGAVEAMALPWQGQSCGSGTRLLVHEDRYDDVVPAVVERVNDVVIGDPFDESSEMGAVVSETQYEKLLSYFDTAREEGATVLTGGEPAEMNGDGYFVKPTIFEVTPEMTLAQEETFGPVLTVMEWSTYEEAIRIANDVEYGLTASIWTTDLDTAHRAADDIQAGYIWVNQHGKHYVGAPFGGYKQSGLGRKECLEEILDHTRVKNVNIDY